MNKYLFLLCSLILIAQSVQGQALINEEEAQEISLNIQSFGVEDGLIDRNVNVYKDSNGFLWVYSSAGLQRYDGYNFKEYELTGDAKNKIFQNIIEDDQGWLYLSFIESQKGGAFIHPITGEQRSIEDHLGAEKAVELLKLISEYQHASFPTLYENPRQLYFTKGSDIVTFNFREESQTTTVDLNQDIQLELIDRSGNFLISINPRLVFLVNQQGRILKEIKASLSGSRQLGPYASNAGEYIYLKLGGEKEGIYRFSADTELEYVLEPPEDYYFAQLVGNWAWCLNDQNWLVINMLTGAEKTIPRDHFGSATQLYGYHRFTPDGPERVIINSDFGFKIVDLKPNPFKHYFHNDGELRLASGNSIRGIWNHGNKLLFVNEFQSLVSLNTDTPNEYNIEIGSDGGVRHPAQGLTGGPLIRARDGYYWGSGAAVIVRIDSSFEHATIYEHQINEPNRNNFERSWTLFEDEQGCVWGSFNDGLVRLCGTEETFYPQDDQNHLKIYHFVPKGVDEFWLCTDLGLFVFNRQSGKFTARYGDYPTADLQLPATIFRYLYLAENGDRWLATNNGLIYWPAVGSPRLYNHQDGLLNDNLYAALPDDYGRLWISSDFGIAAFDTTSRQFSTYQPKDGIGQEEFNRVAHFKATDGTIFFGGLNGITAFHPDDFQPKDRQHAKMQWTIFELFEGQTEQLKDQLPIIFENNEIQFRPNDRYLKIAFSLPTYEDVKKTFYAWKIEGIDDSWNYQSENTLQFGALPYGNHVLRIKGQSPTTGWSPHELAVTVHVIKPFYLQTWFLLSSLLALITSVFLFLRLRTQVLKKEISKATATIEQQAEELRQLDRLKSRFFANVSHELRTPLSLMLGPIKRLIARSGLKGQNLELLSFLERNTIHLKGLVNEILDLSKLESNKMELKEKPTLFKSYLQAHLSQYYSIGNSEQIVVTGKIGLAENLCLYLDQNKFEKVVNNFLSNAIKFTPVDGKVSLQVSASAETLTLSVTDTGRGIDPADLPHVFDRFYQSKADNAPTEGGTGIGLSMCRELAQLMDGRVWAESELGKGSSFFFAFPLKVVPEHLVHGQKAGSPVVEDSSLSRLEDEVSSSSGPAMANKRILIVEDNSDLREYYKIILSDYELHTTEHGQQALDYLAIHPLPDLIISDLMMPVMDGMQLLERLKSSDAYRHLPLIMLTAKTNQQVKIKALRYGIDDYINKPFDEEELRVRIHNLLTYQAGRVLIADSIKSTTAPQMSKADQVWLEDLETYILTHLEETDLSVPQLSLQLAMSESTLLRQLKRMTGLTPKKYLQELRLNQARELLQNQSFDTIAEVGYKVGFKDPTSFTRSFKKRFGKAPTELIV